MESMTDPCFYAEYELRSLFAKKNFVSTTLNLQLQNRDSFGIRPPVFIALLETYANFSAV